jgi:hypothetical protein
MHCEAVEKSSIVLRGSSIMVHGASIFSMAPMAVVFRSYRGASGWLQHGMLFVAALN